MAHREKEKGSRELGAEEKEEGGKKGINEGGGVACCDPPTRH